jgi:hypothetical protein
LKEGGPRFLTFAGETCEFISGHDKFSPIAYARARLSHESASFGQAYGEIVMPALNSEFVSPLVALIAGILILLMPRLLNFVVAIYLIVIGVIGLAPHFQ